MRFRRILIVVSLVSLLLEVNLVHGGDGGKLQDSSGSEGIPFKIRRNKSSSSRSFSRGRFSSHGFRLEGNNASKEQKRMTPGGANRLHNR